MSAGLFETPPGTGNETIADNVMARRIADHDWSFTLAGIVESWPEDLRSVCRTALQSSTPMTVLIGAPGVILFNDAFQRAFAMDVDRSLGKPVTEAMPRAAGFFRDVLEQAFLGRPSSFHDMALETERGGRAATAWFDTDAMPISDARGRVLGALVICVETTARVRAMRDLESSRHRLELALKSGGIVGTWEVDFATETVRSDARYAILHGVDPDLARTGADKNLFVESIHPDDRNSVMAAFDKAKLDGTYSCQHRVVGFKGERWIVASGEIWHGPDGAPLSFAGTAVDVTEQVHTAAALTESEKRFRAYTEALPHIVFSWNRDGHPNYINRRWYEFTGLADGDPAAAEWQAFIHPADRDSVAAEWRRALQSGTKYDATARHRHRSGIYRWMQAVVLPIRDEDGKVASWIGTLTDVHEAKFLETECELVARELDHRIKNFFAVVQGLVSLTLREDHTIQTFAERLRARLITLHRSQNFIRPGGGQPSRTELSLHELVRRLLEPYNMAIHDKRIAVEGDDLALDADKVTAFALVFHELATNAAKYGALCAPEGQIHLLISNTGEHLVLVWKESGGDVPSIAEGDGGFGSRLLHLIVEGQLHGNFRRIPETDGLRVIIELPPMTPSRFIRDN